MPTIRGNSRDYIGRTRPREPVIHGAATGRDVLVGEEGFESFCRRILPTGFFKRSLQEAIEDASLDFGMAKRSPVDLKGQNVILFVSFNNLTQVQDDPFGYSYSGSSMRSSKRPEQETTMELSPLVLRQVDQIVTGISSKMRDRLSQFWKDCSGQAQVSPSTKDAVNELVAWLCSQSHTVSATVSSDSVLSIAAAFPNEVRLYVEIERDGGTEAAVTRERRYACDLCGNTVSELTPEVILAAVGSI